MSASPPTDGTLTRRAYRLVPWLVRALVPEATTGTYVLFAGGHTIYAGRSDTDLQRRLVEHARAQRGEYFDFDAHAHRRASFLTECATFHAMASALENRIHPASPASSGYSCPFCRQASVATIEGRLRPGNFAQEVDDWRPITR